MKTVMKKIFSLMLVAVLLVSAVPFAASAAEETKSWDLTLTAGETYSVDEICKQYYPGSSTNYWVQNGGIRGESFVASADRTYTLYVVETVADPAPTTVTCPTCGETYNEGTTHTCPTVTCPTCGDSYTKGTSHTCPTVTCTTCGDSYTKGTSHTCPTVTCTTCGDSYTKGTSHTCATLTCDTCKATYTKGTAHTCTTVTVHIYDDLNNTEKHGTYHPGDPVSLSDPAWVSGYKFLGWKIKGTSDYVDSSYVVPSNVTSVTIEADWKQTTVTPTYPVKVYARLHTGDNVTDVVEIHHNDTMMSGDKIMDYLKHEDTQALLWNIINSKYSDYTWSGNIYNAYGERAATDNITTVNGSKSVYINLHSKADRVLVYVHMDSMTRKYQYLYEMDGYKVGGPAIRANEVRDFLQTKLGVNFTMKMFDEKGFEDYLDGKSNTQSNYITVTGNPTEVHVRLYVTGNSSSSQADSTNPKTGDMIMAPAIIMCASIGALATLFYLNKKRAI